MIFMVSVGLLCTHIPATAQDVELLEETLAHRDADRMIEKLRDTTLIPSLAEWRLTELKLTEDQSNLAHWFFGLDTVFWVDGRHDAVSWNTGSKSRSTEQAVGVNQGAFAAMRQGKLYTLGGTGIYNDHSNLFVFNVLMGWDLLKVKGLEPAAAHARRVVNVNENEWWVLGNLVPQQDERGEVISPLTIWSLNLADLQWSRVAKMPENLSRHLGDFHVYGAEGYALIFGVSTGGVLNLKTREFVELPQYTLARVPEHEAWGVRDEVLYWMVRGDSGSWSATQLDLSGLYDLAEAQAFFLPLEEEHAQSKWGFALAAGLLLSSLGVGLWLKFKPKSPPNLAPVSPADQPSQEANLAQTPDIDDDADYALVEGLLAQPKRLMNAQEMNELLGIGPDVSEDSQRSRRARAIRRMNAAVKARHDVAFITRERDPNDRRHLLYKLCDLPEG